MHLKKIASPILAIICAGTLAFGTPQSDESWKIFDDSTVGEVKITIAPDFLHFILDPANANSDSLFPATLIFQNAQIATDTVKQIGFRLRGNTSRESAKKSFKVDINHFVPGRQFYGLEKLNLNGEHNDPSIVRAKLCWGLFNTIGLPASRANHIRLYINGQYRGLYLNVEHIDEEFAQKRFGNKNGNLYKCLWPADLAYLGADASAYKKFYGDRPAYELETNKNTDDYSDLVHLIDVLNNTPAPLFKSELEKVFNVDNFIKWLALNVLLGSWDDYWYLKNNYYLYHNTTTDKFEFIPYDYDNTYGIDWVGIDWGQRNIYRWGNAGESRPLVTRILNVPEYRNAYTRHLADYLDSEFAYENQVPNIDRLKTLITPAVEADSFRTLDWDFSIGDFQVSFQAPVATTYNHVPYGIKPYIQTRIATARAQLKYVNLPPVISEVQHLPAWPEPGQSVWISARISDDDRIASVKLYYRTPATEFLAVEMLDDGNHADGAAGDGVYGFQLPAQGAETIAYYYLTAQDSQTAFSSYPVMAPANALFYLIHPVSDSDVQIKLYLRKALTNSDIGVGLLGSFNDWSKIYPMQKVAEDFWEISFFLAPADYIYKFVTFRDLNGIAGISAWLADPENPRQDGPPYFNSVLTVSDPMIYYLKPVDQETLTTAQPVISARFGQARTSAIDPGSITLKIDQQIVANAGQFYDGQKLELDYRSTPVLAPGRHQIFLSAKTRAGLGTEQLSEFWLRRPLLFINEFMASNQRTIADNAGDYDDWIELFNAGEQPINLNGMYLTDDLSRPQRWQLSDTTIAAGGFLLIWADEDQNQGPLHTNFKLSAGGEHVGLFASVADGNFCLDSLRFGPQKTDISWGRFPEAGLNWSFMPPTPGDANRPGTATGVDRGSVPGIWALHPNFPNSFNRQTCIGFDLAEPALVSLRIFNVSGQLIKTFSAREFQAGTHTIYWQGDNEQGHPVPSGTYFYQVQAGKLQATRKMILLR